MTIKVALEYEENEKAIAVYKHGDLISHFRLEESDDEYRIFEITSHLIKNLGGW
jgi:hypothetical protein